MSTLRPYRTALLAMIVVAMAALVLLASRDAPTGSSATQTASTPAAIGSPPHGGTTPTTAVAAGFAGSSACAGCHARETALWKTSHHAKAMQHANAGTVLGNFDRASIEHFGNVSTFFRREDRFFVRTDGPDGTLTDFEILYTFGVTPLQQYLIGFPDGRLQALSIAWDSRPANEGGQHWFHLYPDAAVRAGDPLHWTRREQNWNWMCAECHSTRVERHFDAASNRYATTFSDMNVGCEACHGPGERHIAWTKASADAKPDPTRGLVVALDERRGVHWTMPDGRDIAERNRAPETRKELAVCAQCHARRATLATGLSHTGDVFDTHDLALLVSPLYYPDGQQRGEVYNTGSFMSSRMYAKGVTCSDCHEPHSGTLRAEGNAVCSQCHRPARYDTEAHTLHAAGSRGAACTACHMPTTAYMVVDARHDHSFRVPRPDLSERLGTPNACNQCHRESDAAWAAAVIEKHFGPTRRGFQAFGEAFHAAELGTPAAESALLAVARDTSASTIARASAIVRLEPYLGPRSLPAVEEAAAAADPLLRGAAMDALLSAPPGERVRIAATRIDDRARIVRIKAARALAIAPDDGMAPAMRARLQPLFDEYLASQRANADRPEPLVNLGGFHADRGDPLAAEAAYREALRLEPDFVPAYANLADLYRAYGRDADAEQTLTAGLASANGDAGLTHALGLLRVRQGRKAAALTLLQQAAGTAPENPRYALVLGIALHDSGKRREAIDTLDAALDRFPYDPDIIAALIRYSEEGGDSARAAAYRNRLGTPATGNEQDRL